MDAKSAFVFCVLVGTSSGFFIKTPVFTPVSKIVRNETDWVHLQKLLLPMFEDLYETSTDPVVVRLASEFDLATIGHCFTNPTVLDDLKNVRAKGFLAKNRIFTEYDIDHLNEFRIIYEVLYNAKDLDTFFKAAAWFRQNINTRVFVDAIYTALLTRSDTQHLGIPAPYEILPNFFIDQNVFIKAVTLLNINVNEFTENDDMVKEGNSYVLGAKYTAEYYDNDEESVLAYFQEDIGLNTYYFLKRLQNSPWFNDPSDIDSKYGEYLYFTLKQLAARYDLERYSNGFDAVEDINWENFKSVSYYPMLVHVTGESLETFGVSEDNGVTSMDDEYTAVLKDIENNIQTYVAHVIKFVQDKSAYSKTQILNHLMEVLVTKSNSYEFTARKVLHKSTEKFTTLDHYMTSLRDPMFWRLNKKLVVLVDRALQILPKYTKKQLYFPGVQVVNVDVKKMITMCDNFRFDVTDALKSNKTATTFRTLIEQPRLNHKPFSLKITITSAIKQKGVVKVFLGPKTLPGEFLKYKNSFMLLDSFEAVFKVGSNVVSRSSDDMANLSNDFESIKTLYNKVMDAEFGLEIPPLSTVRSQNGFPSRLIIPKGSEEGLPFQIFVFVAPYVPSTNVVFNSYPVLSPGYPLDLGIEDSDLFELPNAVLKDIVITHKRKSKSSVNTDETEPSEDNYNSYKYVPERTFGQAGSFDYRSKKGQFDYKAKQTPRYGKEDYTYKQGYKTKPVPAAVKPIPTDIPVKNINENIGFHDKTDKNIQERPIPFESLNEFTNKHINVNGKTYQGETYFDNEYTIKSNAYGKMRPENTNIFKDHTADIDLEGRKSPEKTYVFTHTTDNDLKGKVLPIDTYIYKEQMANNDLSGKALQGDTSVYKQHATKKDENENTQSGDTNVYKKFTFNKDMEGKVPSENTYVFKEHVTNKGEDEKTRSGTTYIYKEHAPNKDAEGNTIIYKEHTIENKDDGKTRAGNTYVFKEVGNKDVEEKVPSGNAYINKEKIYKNTDEKPLRPASFEEATLNSDVNKKAETNKDDITMDVDKHIVSDILDNWFSSDSDKSFDYFY